MESFLEITSKLKKELSENGNYQVKEKLIYEHIKTAEQMKYVVDDFSPNLDWFNTCQPLSASLLEGKIVVLDFFTYCCINCLHILPQLRQLEENFSVADGLVVIGVHSAKFDNEKDSQNILLALKKYNISHPVVNDKDFHLWNKLQIFCWPTIVVLGPQRQVILVLVGENHKEELLLFVEVALKFYSCSLSSHSLPLKTCDQIISSSYLNFPGNIAKCKNLFAVSDSGNHRIVVFDSGGIVQFKIGGKSAGFKDGTFENARFHSPQGLVFDGADQIYVADTENHSIRLIDLKSLVVETVVGTGTRGTDREGGKTRVYQEIASPWDVCIVPLSDVETMAPSDGRHKLASFVSGPGNVPPPPPSVGSVCNPPPPPPPIGFVCNPPSSPPPVESVGSPPPPPPPPVGSVGSPPPPPPPIGFVCSSQPPPPPPLSSASSVALVSAVPSGRVLLIAAAGSHQIWAYFIDGGNWWRGKKYEKNVCVAVAGTGREESRNNVYPMMACFAQPSGLAYSPELKAVFIADSESSSIRKLSTKNGAVSHVVGGSDSPLNLFTFGDADGKGYKARLQHPLGVAFNSKRESVFVCDTYNHKLKEIKVATNECFTFHQNPSTLCEPGGCCCDESQDFLFVADTNNHCIWEIRLKDGSAKKLDIKEKQLEPKIEDVWNAEVVLNNEKGILTLRIHFEPKEIHGKWKLHADKEEIQAETLEGKFDSPDIDISVSLTPSDADSFFNVSFDSVLCGEEICAFKKSLLRVAVKREKTGEKAVVCTLNKNLTSNPQNFKF